MIEIVPGIWTWSIFDSEKQIHFNGWYVQRGSEAVVIDPPTPGDNVLAEIKSIYRPLAVLLTNSHHTRASEVIRERYGAPVWVHRNDIKRMEIPVDHSFEEHDSFPCGLKAVHVDHGKTPGETAFYFTGKTNAMIVGDAVIGKPPGALSMLPDEKFEKPALAKPALRVLLEHDFDALLLGDGESIPRGGKKALTRFLG